MSITDSFVRILAEALTVGNGIMNAFVNLPTNAAGPLDPDITVRASGNELVTYLASSALKASDMICVVFSALF